MKSTLFIDQNGVLDGTVCFMVESVGGSGSASGNPQTVPADEQIELHNIKPLCPTISAMRIRIRVGTPYRGEAARFGTKSSNLFRPWSPLMRRYILASRIPIY